MLTLSDLVEKKQDETYAISDYGWKYIRGLSKTVVYRYFNYREIEDLVSMATLDLAWFILNVLIGSDDYPRSIRNVLFTRARNCCTNSINHDRRSEPTDDETLFNRKGKQEADDYEIPIEYKFNTRAEAHILSLKIWDIYNSK